MQFGVIGINYKSASLCIREQAVFTDTKKMEMYVALEQAGIKESVIVSTCNRSELYFLYMGESQIDIVVQVFLTFFKHIDLSPYIFRKKEEAALTYLFEVSNGLHSLILGEDQIAGQIVQSEEFSRYNGQSKKIMNHIFRSVISCTKQAKTMFRMSEHPLSLAYVAIKNLKSKCSIEGKSVLVLGSGKMSTLALTYLMEAKASTIYIANRTKQTAMDICKVYETCDCKVECIEFKERYAILSYCDIVISATASPHEVLQAKYIKEYKHPLYMIDMASPRDIALDVHNLDGVYVEDMDSIQKTIAQNQEIREEKVDDIKNYIQNEVVHVVKWMRSVIVDDTIQTIQERIQQVSEEAFTLLDRKLTLNEHEKYIVSKTLNTSMQRLMKDAILTLKEEEDHNKQEAYHNAMRALFQTKG